MEQANRSLLPRGSANTEPVAKGRCSGPPSVPKVESEDSGDIQLIAVKRCRAN